MTSVRLSKFVSSFRVLSPSIVSMRDCISDTLFTDLVLINNKDTRQQKVSLRDFNQIEPNKLKTILREPIKGF